MIVYDKADAAEIRYKDIVDLGFKSEPIDDSVFFEQFGYPYKIIQLHLSECTVLDWDQRDRKVSIILSDEYGHILKHGYIPDVDTLKELVSFFVNKTID